jgi:hypothetical protein
MISKPQQWTVFQGKFLIRKKLKDETDFLQTYPLQWLKVMRSELFKGFISFFLAFSSFFFSFFV